MCYAMDEYGACDEKSMCFAQGGVGGEGEMDIDNSTYVPNLVWCLLYLLAL